MDNRKYFTFLYVPHENQRLKTVRVRRSLAILLGIVAIGLAAFSTFATIRYVSHSSETYRVDQLTARNEQLNTELQGLRTQVKGLERQVQRNFDFQKKARLLANLDDLSDDVTEVGVGGPGYGYVESLSILEEGTRGEVIDLREDIDKLIRQAKLQTDSYREIISILDENQARLNATPSIRPVPRGYVSSRFGRRMDPFTGQSSYHYGIDYSVRLGSPIFATADGVVTYAGRWHGFGLVVEISHGYGYVTRYAHCSKLRARKGQKIQRGQVIALAGKSGRSTATHLHYEVLHKGKKKDPLHFVLTGNEIID